MRAALSAGRLSIWIRECKKMSVRVCPPALLAAVLLAICGCPSYTPKGGKIYVGQPQVLSRESIVPERQREIEWLREKLKDTPTEASFHGYVDTLIAETLTATLAAEFDPLAIAKSEEATKFEIDRLEGERELLQMKQQIERAKLENRLKEVQEKGLTDGDDLASSPVQDAKLDEIDKKIGKLNETIAALEKRLESGGAGGGKGALADVNDARARPTRAQVTPYELLQDQLAYRNQVNAALRDRMLDETHDLMGRTLYEMKFTVTMVPPTGVDEFAYVRVTIPQEQSFRLRDPNDSVVPGEDKSYAAFVNALANHMYYDALLLLNQKRSNNLTTEQRRFWDSRTEGASRPRQSRLYDELRHQQTFNTYERPLFAPPPLPSDFGFRDVKIEEVKFAAEYLKEKYGDLSELCIIEKPGEVGDSEEDPNDPYLRIVPSPEHSARLSEHLAELVGSGVDNVGVTSVEPKEYSQNISEVAARESMLRLALDLQSIVAQGVEAKGGLGYDLQTRNLLEAIERRPLAMGYNDVSNANDSGGAFGWILGPRFRIKKESPKAVQEAVVYPLTASVVVPSWASELKLKVEYGWISENAFKRRVVECKSIDVPLSPDMGGLVEAYVHRLHGIDRQPRVLVSRNEYRLQKGQRKPALLIRGLNLWRSPRVYVGAVPASHVEIFPDLQGLIAHFDDSSLVPGVADLTVVCTTGQTVVRNRVTILAPPESRPDPFVRVAPARAMWKKGQPLKVRLALDRDRMPPVLPAFHAYAYAAGHGAGHMLISDIDVQGETLQIAVPQALRQTEAIYALVADVRVRRSPSDMFGTSVMAKPDSLIVFTQSNGHKLRLKSAANGKVALKFPKEGGTKPVTVKFPFQKGEEVRLFYQAYPGLATATTAKLSGKGLKPIATRIDHDRQEFVFSIPAPDQKKLDVTDLVVQYSAGEEAIPVLGTLSLGKSDGS